MSPLKNPFSAAARQQKQLGLYRASLKEEYGAHADVYRKVRSLIPSGRLRDVEAMYEGAWASRERMLDGRPLYTAILRWILVTDGNSRSPLKKFLPAFDAEYQKTPTPFWGALYASALQDVGADLRGTKWAHEVTRTQWRGLHEMNALALDVLEATAAHPDAPLHFAWMEAAHHSTLSGHMDRDPQQTWAALYALDPTNLAIVGGRGVQLLPRWHGRSTTDAERFARQAMEATRDEYGTGAYAAVLTDFANISHHTAADSHIDRDLLRQAYEDLLARFPGSVRILNEYANTMSWLDDEPAVWHVYEGHGLRAIVPERWGGDSDATGMSYAVNALDFARRNH